MSDDGPAPCQFGRQSRAVPGAPHGPVATTSPGGAPPAVAGRIVGASRGDEGWTSSVGEAAAPSEATIATIRGVATLVAVGRLPWPSHAAPRPCAERSQGRAGAGGSRRLAWRGGRASSPRRGRDPGPADL